MRDAFVHKLTTIATNNPRVFLITGDLGFGVLTDFAQKFPSQFLNVGVAEQNMIGVATGLALEGRVVFVYSIGNFPTLRCLEQIRNDACYHDANVKIVSIGGGFSYGALGMSHHATEDISILRALPGMKVNVPCDAWEAGEITAALVEESGTAYLRLDKSKATDTHVEGEIFCFGTIRVLGKGQDVTIVCTGGILGVVLEAVKKLEKAGIGCRVLAVHSIKPFDKETLIDSARQTSALVTVEEHTIMGGLGGVVSENLLDAGILPKLFLRIGLNDQYASTVGSQDFLRTVYGMDETSIAIRIERLFRPE